MNWDYRLILFFYDKNMHYIWNNSHPYDIIKLGKLEDRDENYSNTGKVKMNFNN